MKKLNAFKIVFWDQTGEQLNTFAVAKTMARALYLFEEKHNPLLIVSINLYK